MCRDREKAERRKKLTNVKNEVTTLDYRLQMLWVPLSPTRWFPE